MYSINLNQTLPTSNNLIFINKETKKYIHVDLKSDGDKIEALIFKSDDGINLQFPVINDPIVDALPPLPETLTNASLIVIKYFNTNGFKLVDTISSIEDGLKFS